MFAKFRNQVMTVVAPDMPALPDSTGHSSSATASAAAPSSSSTNIFSQHRMSGSGGGGGTRSSTSQMPDKFAYSRPPFLQLLTYDELKASADHNVRPIIVPRDINVLPWNTGYAECVNSGKSEWNEDQAAFCRQVLINPNNPNYQLPYTYFGIFDGHAGYGAALAASHQFHHILHEKLVDVIDMLMPPQDMQLLKKQSSDLPHPAALFHRTVTKDELIIGALESAFMDMDTLLAEDRSKYRNAGGCTALVTLFIYGKMFVSNAGDSRAVLCQRLTNQCFKNQTYQLGFDHLIQKPIIGQLNHTNNFNKKIDEDDDEDEDEDDDDDNFNIYPIAFSHDHTPDTERGRLMSTAKLNSSLMGGGYVAMEYAKRPIVKDLGQRILYRQGTMKGWAYKTLTTHDLKMPIVTGEGKRSRLMGTIGVTRGFGDHDLRALGSGLPIKPFLSSHPEVIYRDLSCIVTLPEQQNEDGDYGILVMATDGLWDVSDIENVSMIVFNTLSAYPTEKHRYTMIAQELVAKSRGRINDSGHWRLADSKAAATVDDISVICIPVYQYYKEYLEWQEKCQNDQHNSNDKLTSAQISNQQKLQRIINGSMNVQEEQDIDEISMNSTSREQLFHNKKQRSGGAAGEAASDDDDDDDDVETGTDTAELSDRDNSKIDGEEDDIDKRKFKYSRDRV